MRGRNQTLIKRAQEDAVARNRERLVESFRNSVPDRYLRFTIEGDYLSDGSEIIDQRTVVALRAVIEDEPTFTVIRGPQGTGKTTLAVSILEHWMNIFDLDVAPNGNPLNARLMTFTKLLGELSFNREVMDELAHTYILAIDDIGAGSDTISDHQLRYLTDLIDDRWSRDLPTIITTNMPITSQRDSRGLSDMFASQSWDRISSSSRIISLEGESLRGDD